jgi:Zn-dependent protease with chaperone function
MDPKLVSRLNQLLFLSRLELPLWFLSGVPSLLLLGMVLLLSVAMGNPSGLLLAILYFISLHLALLALGSVYDHIRGWFRPARHPLPPAILSHLEPLLTRFAQHGLRLPASALRVVKNDLSLAAHVTGTFQPNVVVSGGLVVGLLRNDPRAQAILAHEIAHIAHYDRLLPSMIMVTLGNALLAVPLALMPLGHGSSQAPTLGAALLNLIVTPIILSIVSRRREYLADIHAAYALGSTRDYLRTLLAGRERGAGDFFHPSMTDRVEALAGRGAGRIIRLSWLWVLWWIAVMLSGASTLLDPGQDWRDEESFKALAQVLVALIGIALEAIKPRLARPFLALLQSARKTARS